MIHSLLNAIADMKVFVGGDQIIRLPRHLLASVSQRQLYKGGLPRSNVLKASPRLQNVPDCYNFYYCS